MKQRLGCGSMIVFLLLISAPASAQSMEIVSIGSDGALGNARSMDPAVSADGRFVAFTSFASNFVPFDLNNADDIFVRDRQTGEVTRVSVSSTGVEAWFDSFSPAISADGRYVAFESLAPNLVPGDTNQYIDIFVHDRVTGETQRVSVSSDGSEANDTCQYPDISVDGRFVAFHSKASNLVLGIAGGVFVHDRLTGETTCASTSFLGASGGGTEPSISADGRYVAFTSRAENFVPEDPNSDDDIYVKDRQTNQIIFASPGVPTGSNWDSWGPSISANGRLVAFVSDVENLVPDDTNGVWDAFVFDIDVGVVTRVSVSSTGEQADHRTTNVVISGDGRFVAFVSDAENLVGGPAVRSDQIYLRDRLLGVTTRASVTNIGIPGYGDHYRPSISAAGRFIAFDSDASNYTHDTNEQRNVFLHDQEGLVGDINGDGDVDVSDLLELLSSWGPCIPGFACFPDLDGSGNVGVIDLLLLLASWS